MWHSQFLLSWVFANPPDTTHTCSCMSKCLLHTVRLKACASQAFVWNSPPVCLERFPLEIAPSSGRALTVSTSDRVHHWLTSLHHVRAPEEEKNTAFKRPICNTYNPWSMVTSMNDVNCSAKLRINSISPEGLGQRCKALTVFLNC